MLENVLPHSHQVLQTLGYLEAIGPSLCCCCLAAVLRRERDMQSTASVSGFCNPCVVCSSGLLGVVEVQGT